MKRLIAMWVMMMNIVAMGGLAMAGVTIQRDRVSINVSAVPLVVVLDDLAHQGGIDVTNFTTENMKLVTVTEQFQGVSVEKGLEILLAEWNYGLTKHPATGRIREIFIASKRSGPVSTPTTRQPLPSSMFPARSKKGLRYERSLVGSFQEDESDDELSLEGPTDLAHAASTADVTEEILPKDLPPEIREQLLQEIAANRELR